jgi:hypothetical protein
MADSCTISECIAAYMVSNGRKYEEFVLYPAGYARALLPRPK